MALLQPGETRVSDITTLGAGLREEAGGGAPVAVRPRVDAFAEKIEE